VAAAGMSDLPAAARLRRWDTFGDENDVYVK
jgi:hypothetical protein